jgi:hypothetical protein
MLRAEVRDLVGSPKLVGRAALSEEGTVDPRNENSAILDRLDHVGDLHVHRSMPGLHRI